MLALYKCLHMHAVEQIIKLLKFCISERLTLLSKDVQLETFDFILCKLLDPTDSFHRSGLLTPEILADIYNYMD
jgi:hypothetical protein